MGQDKPKDTHQPPEFADAWKLEVEGHREFWRLHAELRKEITARWNRSLPLADEILDRWERARYLGFGPGASIYDASLVMGDVQVGEETWIGPYTVLDGRGGLKIGCYCSISAGVQIYSHDTVKWALTRGKAAEERGATEIGDCCYIGPNCIISRGVKIGEHCVIGAMSFVKEDIPSFSIAAGSPARVVGRVEMVGEDDVRLIYQ
jgi:acetyltransferase-like isoleucine patch superfamily enzyme